jgi:hypothetical protein
VGGQTGLLACGGSLVSLPPTVPGNVYLTGTNGGSNPAIPPENGSATDANPSTCVTPDSNATCTLTVTVAVVNTVAVGNTFNANRWATETLFGAIDGSGPYGQDAANAGTYIDGYPSPPPLSIQNTWTNNTGSPANSPSNPTTLNPASP